MYLHNDKDLFEEILNEANAQTGITRSIIEKDYYVTMILKLLRQSAPEIVFKGGTSLSKCFHLIDRFSEDIDITYSEHIGESRRKKLIYELLDKEFYKSDYNNITRMLIFDDVTYEQVSLTLREIVKKLF